MSIDNYVSVAISLASPSVTQVGFGVPMFAGTTVGWLTGNSADLIRFYTSAPAVLVDFAAGSPEYLAAVAAFGVTPTPPQIAIGKVPTSSAGVMTVAFSGPFVAANVVNGNVLGAAIAPVTYGTSNAFTLTALAAAIALNPGVASAVSDGTSMITVTFNVGYTPSLTGFVVTLGAGQVIPSYVTTTPAVLLSTGLAAIRVLNQGWYGLAINSRTIGDILDVAAWSETVLVKFGGQSSDASCLTNVATDVMSVLKTKLYFNSFCLFHAINTEHAGFAWLAQELSYVPGSATWMYKTLANITPDAITDTQRANVLSKNGNFYSTQSGINMTENGMTASGQYIDIVVGRDWLQANLKTDIFSLLATAPKIPYTDKGASQVEGLIRARLQTAVNNGILSDTPAFTVSVPKVATQLTADRGNRYFPGITFNGTLAGAIHKVAMTGTVSV